MVLKMKKLFEQSQKPLIRTIISIGIPIIIGILSSVYTADITTSSGISFQLSFKKASFYILLILSSVSLIYYYLLYKFESDLYKYRSNDFCIAYMRSQLIPEIAESYRKQIRSGQITDLAQTMDNFMRSLNQ